MSWQTGQLGFGARAVLDLQAIAWPNRLRALTLLLQEVADGRPLPEVTTEVADIAATALLHLTSISDPRRWSAAPARPFSSGVRRGSAVWACRRSD